MKPLRLPRGCGTIPVQRIMKINTPTILWQARPDFLSRLPSCVAVLALLGIVPFFFDDYIGLASLILFALLYLPVWLLSTLVFVFRRQYILDRNEISMISGIFRKKTVSLKKEQIAKTQVQQDFMGRLLGYGRLVFSLHGISWTDIRTEPVRCPDRVRDMILGCSPEKPSC